MTREQLKQQSGGIPAMQSRKNLLGEHKALKGVKDTLKKLNG